MVHNRGFFFPNDFSLSSLQKNVQYNYEINLASAKYWIPTLKLLARGFLGSPKRDRLLSLLLLVYQSMVKILPLLNFSHFFCHRTHETQIGIYQEAYSLLTIFHSIRSCYMDFCLVLKFLVEENLGPRDELQIFFKCIFRVGCFCDKQYSQKYLWEENLFDLQVTVHYQGKPGQELKQDPNQKPLNTHTHTRGKEKNFSICFL